MWHFIKIINDSLMNHGDINVEHSPLENSQYANKMQSKGDEYIYWIPFGLTCIDS